MSSTFLSFRPSRWRALLATGFVAFLVCVCVCVGNRRPLGVTLPLLRIGQTTSSLGEYRLPGCEQTLQICRDQNGDIHTDVQSPRVATLLERFTNIPFGTVADTQREYGGVVPADASWFASVDECKNLWVCCGTTGSSTPTVIVYGLRFFPPDGQLARGFENVMETDNWIGVPRQFLDKLHADYDTDIGPTERQGYTEDNKVEIAQLLNEAS